MSDIAAQARAAAVAIEFKKDGLRQTQDGQWKITLTALELPSWLITARPGTRIMGGLVEIGDNEEPVSHEAPLPPSSPPEASARPAKNPAAAERFRNLPPMKQDVTKAAMLTEDATFQGWILGPRYDASLPKKDLIALADKELKSRLYIYSKAEIGEGRAANERFHTLKTT